VKRERFGKSQEGSRAEHFVERRGEQADEKQGHVGPGGDGDVELEEGGEEADQDGVDRAGAAGHGANGGGGGEEEGHEEQGAGEHLVIGEGDGAGHADVGAAERKPAKVDVALADAAGEYLAHDGGDGEDQKPGERGEIDEQGDAEIGDAAIEEEQTTNDNGDGAGGADGAGLAADDQVFERGHFVAQQGIDGNPASVGAGLAGRKAVEFFGGGVFVDRGSAARGNRFDPSFGGSGGGFDALGLAHVAEEQVILLKHPVGNEGGLEDDNHEQVGDEDGVNASGTDAAEEPGEHDEEDAAADSDRPLGGEGFLERAIGGHEVNRQHEREQERKVEDVREAKLPAASGDAPPEDEGKRG
jgi:hypothetical protein